MIPSLVSLLLVALATFVTVNGVIKFDKLDLSACYGVNKAVCYIPDRCDRQNGAARNNGELINAKVLAKGTAENCHAAAIFKRFTDRKWLVSLTMIHLSIDGKKEIGVKRNHQKLFVCKSDATNTVVVESPSYTIDIHSTVVGKTGILCKFTVEGEIKQNEDSPEPFTVYSLLNGVEHPHSKEWNTLHPEITNTGKCDPSSFDFHAKPLADDETSLRPLYEFDIVKCDAGATLKILKGGKAFNAAIECQNTNRFKVTNLTENKVLTDLTRLNVVCTTKTCTRCGNVDKFIQGSNDNGAMGYNEAVGNGCAELTCNNNLIEIDGAPATASKPFCKEVKEGTGDFRWAIVHPTLGKTLTFTEAACPKTVKCNDVRKLDIECESTKCDMIDPTLSKITCSSDYRLATKSTASPKWSIIENINCKSITGDWIKLLIDKNTQALGEGEKIKCLTAKEAEAAEEQHVEPTAGGSTTSTEKSDVAAASSTSIGTVIAIAGVGILVIMIIAGFGFYAVRKRRAKEDRDFGEVDAKPPTPPATDKDSDKYNAAEVSFSGRNRPPTPSLKTSKDESDPLNFTNVRVQPSPNPSGNPSGKQFEDAVSVTAHLPCPPSGGSSDKPSDKPSDKTTPRPAAPPSTTPPPPAPDSAEISKKKVAELLDQSVPSMSE